MWRGIDVALILVFTGLALIGAFIVGVVLVAVLGHSGIGALAGIRPLVDLRFLLAVQAAALAAGFVFAALWIKHLYHARFWRAIHWRPLPAQWVAALVFGGVVLSLFLEILEHYLPIPQQLPVDRLFTPRTAWMMTFYGVAIAPFFEEFVFRGLIYPSLRRSFAVGMSRSQARVWRPFLWAGAAAGAVLAGLMWMQDVVRQQPASRARAGLIAAIVCGVLAAPIMDGIAAVYRALARWQQPELLAILVTGVLFGLAHSDQLANALLPVALISLVGIALTTVRALTGSLVASWIMHCVYNGTLFVLLFIGTRGYHDFHRLVH